MGTSDSVFLLHQDSPEHADGLRLAVASLRRALPRADLLVSAPSATRELADWLAARGCIPFGVSVPRTGWDLKPDLLIAAIERAGGPVIWLDADIICAADPRPLWAHLGPEVLVCTEDPSSQGASAKTSAWGLAPGRALDVTVNSSVIRASDAHLGLLREWQSMLMRPEYRTAQAQPWHQRPIHLMGDQEVLTALLGSAAYRTLPLKLLRSGPDIAHCFTPASFPVRARLGAPPPLLHSQGVKPWRHRADWPYTGPLRARARAAITDAHLRLSPYSIHARRLAVEAGIDAEGFAPIYWWERLLLGSGSRSPSLPELPMAVTETVARSLARHPRGAGS